MLLAMAELKNYCLAKEIKVRCKGNMHLMQPLNNPVGYVGKLSSLRKLVTCEDVSWSLLAALAESLGDRIWSSLLIPPIHASIEAQRVQIRCAYFICVSSV